MNNPPAPAPPSHQRVRRSKAGTSPARYTAVQPLLAACTREVQAQWHVCSAVEHAGWEVRAAGPQEG